MAKPRIFLKIIQRVQLEFKSTNLRPWMQKNLRWEKHCNYYWPRAHASGIFFSFHCAQYSCRTLSSCPIDCPQFCNKFIRFDARASASSWHLLGRPWPAWTIQRQCLAMRRVASYAGSHQRSKTTLSSGTKELWAWSLRKLMIWPNPSEKSGGMKSPCATFCTLVTFILLRTQMNNNLN